MELPVRLRLRGSNIAGVQRPRILFRDAASGGMAPAVSEDFRKLPVFEKSRDVLSW
jgi:hypothetical protein